MWISRSMSRDVIISLSRPAAAVLVLLASACVSVPDIGEKAVPLDAEAIAAGESLAGDRGGEWPQEEWWRSFGDAQLEALIVEGLGNSPDVAAATARFHRAAGMSLEAGADLWPEVNADGGVYKDRRSLNNGFGDEIKQFLPRGWRNGGDVSARLDYELDFWGRNRAALAAAVSEARAAEIEEHEARLILATSIADAYADLARLYELQDIRTAAVKVRTSSRDLVSNRVVNGVEMQGNLWQAEAQVEAAKAQLVSVENEIALRKHQIAALVGAGPDRGLSIERPNLSSYDFLDLPDGVTTDLIGRRPDIVAARERVEAAGRRIAVARTGFYPSISLGALIGYQSIGLNQLFEGDSVYGRAGPAVSLPIFRGGALRGRYRQARANFDESVANYDRIVLDAYRQVADAVTARDNMRRQLRHARDSLGASQAAYEIAGMRYDGGLSGYLDVLDVEDRMLEARLSVAELEAAQRLLDIALIRSLGGGFGPETADPVKELPNG